MKQRKAKEKSYKNQSRNRKCSLFFFLLHEYIANDNECFALLFYPSKLKTYSKFGPNSFSQTNVIVDTKFHPSTLPICSSSLASSLSESDFEKNLQFEIFSSISSISSQSWNSFLHLNGPSSPFLEHSWLRCLEESNCASPETGWVPYHLSVSIQNNSEKVILAYVPIYIKDHSQGEFIFDHSWADYAYSIGTSYYPKLLIGVPFTPVTGTRILMNPKTVCQTWCEYNDVYQGTINKSKATKESESTILELFRQIIGRYLTSIVQSNSLSSVHINFLTNEEATSLAGNTISEAFINSSKEKRIMKLVEHPSINATNFDFLRRTTIQYHWENKHPDYDDSPYESFDEYLETFKSKKRINIKRERRKILQEENIRIDAIEGRDILKYPGLVEKMFDIYVSTVDKMYWGNQYLTLEFFVDLCNSDFVDHLCFICARYRPDNEYYHEGEKDDDIHELDVTDIFAGTFNIVQNGVFYGRYWGCLKEVKYLHFEVCYWSAIEYCIMKGLHRMEPGAGGGEHKWARGFDATLVHSVHYIKDETLRNAVEEFLHYEKEEDIETTEYLKAKRLGQI